MIASTVGRVPQNTANYVNDRIRCETEKNVTRWAAAGPDALEQRLQELDREWNIERTLQANAASVTLVGSILGGTVDRRWFILPAFVGGFLLMHAIQGWCPPVPVLRRLGFRTASEIDEERYALKALRGDFRNIPPGDGRDPKAVRRAMEAVH